MARTFSLLAGLFIAGNLLASCTQRESGSDSAPPPPPGAAPPPASPGGAPPPAAGASLSDPKGSISYQLDLIKAGDVEKLKACLTPRVRNDVTAVVVEKAKGDASKYTIDDLYASAEMGEAGGKKTAKVKMKNGRTLTTLIQTDGKWLADTIWFK